MTLLWPDTFSYLGPTHLRQTNKTTQPAPTQWPDLLSNINLHVWTNRKHSGGKQKIKISVSYSYFTWACGRTSLSRPALCNDLQHQSCRQRQETGECRPDKGPVNLPTVCYMSLDPTSVFSSHRFRLHVSGPTEGKFVAPRLDLPCPDSDSKLQWWVTWSESPAWARRAEPRALGGPRARADQSSWSQSLQTQSEQRGALQWAERRAWRPSSTAAPPSSFFKCGLRTVEVPPGRTLIIKKESSVFFLPHSLPNNSYRTKKELPVCCDLS